MKKNRIDHPKFAVVGHPNKGKSSIVASLAMDDSIAISDVPGTTTRSRSFPLKVDGEVVYELFDTPGFQRARQVLAWLSSHDVGADKRHEVVASFVREHRNDPKFRDEVELLSPLIDGAGIIYVVDASKPYGEEYEAEMEILRWTGQPSMALINHIDDNDYSAEWKRALSGYFQIIRTYDPMRTDLRQHIAVLESMAQLREEWTDKVKRSVVLFESYHAKMIERSAAAIADLIVRALSHTERLSLWEASSSSQKRAQLEEAYRERLRSFEAQAQRQIERIWNHTHIRKEQEDIVFDKSDLFSEESASLFGLTRKELMITGATTGAVTGAGIDLFFAGHTMLIGGAIGALAGGVGAYFAFDELADIKVLGQRLGKRYLQMGPMKNRNFPYILLGRMLYYTGRIATLSHASRETISLKEDEAFTRSYLDDNTKKRLESLHQRFRGSKSIDEESLKAYAKEIETILRRMIE